MKLYEYYQKKRPQSYVDNWHLRWIAEAFERAILHRRNAIIEAPPRHSKSELCNIYGPAWALGEGRTNESFMLICNSDTLARKFSTACRGLVELSLSEDKGHAWKVSASESFDSSYHASGLRGQLSGRGATVELMDDILKNAQEAQSQTVRDSMWENVASAAINRLSPDGVVIALQARLHEQDVIGRLLSLDHMRFIRARFPATNDSGTESFFEDPYAGEKVVFPAYEALWPERYPREKLDEIKATVSQRWWMGQYQCAPSMGDDVWFDLTRCPKHSNLGKLRRWWVACDFANTATKAGSRSAFVALGLDEQEDMLRLLGCSAGRWKHDDMGNHLVEFASSVHRIVGTRPEAIVVESAAGGYGIIDRYEHVLRIVPISPKGSKELRAQEVCWLVNRGRVSLPIDAPWLREFTEEVGGFPLAALNDIPDAFVHSLKYVVSNAELKRPDETEVYVHDSTDRSGERLREEMEFYKDLGTDEEMAFDFINNDPGNLCF